VSAWTDSPDVSSTLDARATAVILLAMRSRAPLLWLTAWSAAFGVCEGAVVVYLRRLCYPGQPPSGPLLPLPEIDTPLLRTEMAREAATLLMLLGVAMLAERRPLRRFAAFAFCFGVWDLVYYAFLHVALGWPASVMDWDVLFLIPKPWASPVLAPVLVSLALVGASALLLRRDEAASSPLRAGDWLGQIACGALIVGSFLWNAETVDRCEPPGAFPWWLFLAGLIGGLLVFGRALRRAA
jgi:hypothetical protein